MNRFSWRVYGLTCVLMILASAAAHATTIILPTDEALVAKSPVIVSGTVTSTVPYDHNGAIWTDTTIAVSRNLKGATADTITVHEIGGTLDDRITKVFGAPEFQEGERVLLFLEPAPQGGYRVMDLFIGKFAEGTTLDGRRMWLRHDSAANVTLLDGNFAPIAPTNVQRDAARFETFVADRVAGRAGAKDYGIDNPVLAQDARPKAGGITSDFTLISEPTVYRWWFDSGSKPWYSSGTQPGYTNGGVSELQTAIGVWTNYAEALIRYTYNGGLTVTPKGLGSTNGYNEVLFNDPLNEISGSWNRSTGGVVGRGGFNGVAGGKNFTATFQADASHPAGTVYAYQITEGNLTIQDNVSPANGISSSTLAEIVAHELGHTLGFGHSEATNALMYYSVTGLGPSLRDDDKVAARWLYPNGGTSTPPAAQVPAAPSNLVATASANAVDLRWTDNATNETGQSIYLSVGGGAFAKVADVGAGITAAHLSGLASGSYRAYVVASNSAGNSATSNTASFAIAAAPVAGFSFSPTSGNSGTTTFTFYDESTGAITSRSWSFGDGSTATASVVNHVYTTSGQYPVTLTVTGNGGSSSITKTVSVSGPLNALFAFSPPNPTTSDTVQFTDQSGGAPSSWQWNFGDNTTSTQQNPAKKYGAQGTYTVSLTVFRNGGAATTSKLVTVSGSSPGTTPVVASFDVSTSAASAGSAVAFTDRSSGNPTQWSWSFGDGSTSAQQNPTHTYASSGTFTVTLMASKSGSSSTASRQITVSSIVPYRTLISAAAQTAGLGGTSWRTELSIYNAGLEGASVTLRFLPTLAQRTIFLAPRQSLTYANTLYDLFGLSSGAGAVSIEASSAGSSAQLRVTSRTFTLAARGTFGQAVPEVQPEDLERTLYVTGIQSNSAYRTNLGFVNRAGADVPVSLSLYAKNGTTVASKTITLGANSFQQNSLGAFFPDVQGVSYDALTLRVGSGASDAVSVYASVVDNVSQDPIYIQAAPQVSGNSLIVPAVGRAAGANGTYWRSDVTFFNPSTDSITLTLRFGNSTRTLALGGRDTAVLTDILSSFGLSSGSGALRVSWTGSAPVVTSRTYTNGENGGTFGQSIDPIEALRTTSIVPGLRNDGAFRSNIGFVNGGTETETFTVLILSQSGTELGRNTLTLAANGQVQYSVNALFPNVNASSFTLAVQGDANSQLFAFGSMVDNASGDPVFFAGQ